jgi:outer membrane protein assembly factor BamD
MTRKSGRSLAILIAALSLAALPACSSGSIGSFFSSEEKKEETKPADVLYKEGENFLNKGEYTYAAEKFAEVERQHPYAPEAKTAMVWTAFAYYKAGKSTEAVAAARRFISMHPGSKEAAVAQYVIAWSYFDRINDPQRDQSDTRRAVVELETLVRRYPDSRYAEEARQRIKVARDVLAGQEMEVGRFYMKKGQFNGAIMRFQTVVSEYQTTAHVEEALHRLTECYLALGIENEAKATAAVLGHNFPESEWYKRSYALLGEKGIQPSDIEGSWISRTWRKAVKSVQG